MAKAFVQHLEDKTVVVPFETQDEEWFIHKLTMMGYSLETAGNLLAKWKSTPGGRE